MGPKKKVKKKDKGPKGKIARSKAKLERRWGEQVDEKQIQADRHRRGRSRLLTKKNTNGKGDLKGNESSFAPTSEKKRPYQNRNDEGSIDYSSSSSDDEDSQDENVIASEDNGALKNLLTRIKKSGKNTSFQKDAHHNQPREQDARRSILSGNEDNSSGSDDSESDDEDPVNNDGISDIRQKSIEISVESDIEDDDVILDKDEQSDLGDFFKDNDPFTAHFSRPSFTTEDVAIEQLAQNRATESKHVDTSSLNLNKTIELHASGSSSVKIYNNTDSNENTPHRYLRKVLAARWKAFNATVARDNIDCSTSRNDSNRSELSVRKKGLSSLQASIFPALTSYVDILSTAETRENQNALLNLAALHILNHTLTSQARVQKHDRRIRELTIKEEKSNEHIVSRNKGKGKQKSKKMKTETVTETAPVSPLFMQQDHWKDQGYTRPKILVLLPTRGKCLVFVQKLMDLLGSSMHKVENRDRFEGEFGVPKSDDENLDVDEKRRRDVLKAKGPSWNDFFGDDVNNDDDFKIGLAMSTITAKRAGKKTAKGKENEKGLMMKLYSEFYHSDIILASPLGLKMAGINSSKGDDDDDEDNAEQDWDFLSSIEICLVTHADVLMMQNWDHVVSILENLNGQPKKNNNTDFSRVRAHLLAGQGRHWRQLVCLSGLSDAHLLSTFKKHAVSVAGQLRMRRTVPLREAAVCDVLVRAKQVFQRVPCSSLTTQNDDRLRYFKDEVLPQLVRLRQRHTLIYVPSYFNFVAVRNLLTRAEAEFVSVTEYARVSEVSRGRARFLQGIKHIMLYTGRAHFFHRNLIKGATHLIFFGLPEHGEFYPGVINSLRDDWSDAYAAADGPADAANFAGSSPASCLSMFTRYDAHEMERIVGTKNCERMITGEKSTYLFC